MTSTPAEREMLAILRFRHPNDGPIVADVVSRAEHTVGHHVDTAPALIPRDGLRPDRIRFADGEAHSVYRECDARAERFQMRTAPADRDEPR
jgi:hypothetical protein